MKKLFRLMAVAVIALAMAACGSSNNTPEGATKAMLKSYQKGDFKALVEQIHFSKEVSQEEKDQLVTMLQGKITPELEKKGGIKDFEVGVAEVAEDGQSAKVPYKLIYGDGSEKEDTQKLLLVDGKWLLDEGK